MRNSSGGARQLAWTALSERPFETVVALADHIGCLPESLRGYVGALQKRGYVTLDAQARLALTRRTGARAPSWSVHTDEFRDWNLEPTMSGADLGAAIAASKLSFRAWLEAHGRHPAGVARLRQMVNGQRPVSEDIAALAAVGREG